MQQQAEHWSDIICRAFEKKKRQISQIIMTLVVNLVSSFREVYLLLLTQSLVRSSRHTQTEM